MITLNRKVRFTANDFSYSPTYTEYLFGSLGSRITADIRVDVEWSTQGVNMKFLASDDSIERLDGVSTFINDGFKPGDTIVITGTASNNSTTTISSISDDGMILFVAAALVNETVIANVFGETPIISIDFYPNLIKNGTDFGLFNLTDRETMPLYHADTITTDAANPTPMVVGTNSKGWVTPADAATVYRLSFTNHIQTFVISHTFTITPIFLANQLSAVKRGIPPAAGAYQDAECLKYVYTIDGKYSSFDPDPPHSTDGNVTFPLGQTGWFNEFVNGRPTIWTKSSIKYYNNVNNAGLTSIDYSKVVDVEAIIQCQKALVATPIFIIHVMLLPTNEEEYINTVGEYKTNFVYERGRLSAGTGENTGNYHFLKNITHTGLSGNRSKLNFKIDFSQTIKDLFDCRDSDNLNYLIFITCGSESATPGPGSSFLDQTALIMDVNTYQCDKQDSTLFQIIDEIQFFEYPQCDGQGYSNFRLLPRDTVLAKAQFHVKQGTELNPIILKNLSASIVAVRQNDLEEFNLESFPINTSGDLPNGDNVQEIYFTQERDFILPTDDCHKEIRLFRMPTLDIAGYSAYELIYPFKVRWEIWRSLEGAGRFFPTPTQDWMRYANQAGWSVKFSLKAQVDKQYPATSCLVTNPVITNFEHIVWGAFLDPCDLPYSGDINMYDITGVNDYEGVVAEDVDTKIIATINGDFNGVTESELYGILTLDARGIGGVAYSQEIGTRTDVDAGGVWYGASSTLRATLTKVDNNTVTISAFLNHLFLPTDTSQYVLAATVGKYRVSASSSGTCLNEIMIDEFTCGQLQIIEVTDANTLIVNGVVTTQELTEVPVENMILTRVTSTTWTVSGGIINGNIISAGGVGGNIIQSPAHPYTNASVGDMLEGNIIGTIYSLAAQTGGVGGIGSMQIGCSFFVSYSASFCNLSISLLSDPQGAVSAGAVIGTTITVSNAGPDSAIGVSVADLLPSGFTYQSATPSVGSYNSTTGVWTVGTLANGANATLFLTYAANLSGNHTNIAVVTSDSIDSNIANNTATETFIVS